MTQREFAIQIVQELRAAGHDALWAGGCVRDQLLGLSPNDYDVATSALPDEVRELFGRRRTLSIGAAFGVITVLGARDLTPIEVATFRSDGDYRDGRRPESVEFTNAEVDAKRRDFTINGMFFDPVDNQVVDYVGGEQDLQLGIIRAIGDASARFNEDKLRMLRAVRFAAAYDFQIDPLTFAAIRQMADQVDVVSAERIGSEVERVLLDANRRRGVELLGATELLVKLLPEWEGFSTDQGSEWIGALDRLGRLHEPSLATAMACLLLEVASPQQAKACCRRLRFPAKTADRTAWLIEHAPIVEQAEQVPWPRLQRTLVAAGIAELMALAEAEWSASHAGVARCRNELARPAAELNPPPLVNGNDLIASGLSPGKHFSDLLDYLRDLQLEGRLSTADQALKEAAAWVARSDLQD